jgi:RNA polymerase sigma-70 factor (ECF subfamily)
VDDLEVHRKTNLGDARTFDEFYRQTAPRLQAFLRQIVGSREAAEDVAQETYIQLWKRPSGFQPERGALRTYLFGVGRKRAAEWWRRQSPAAEPANEAMQPDRAESSSVMADAMQRLPEEQRTLLWLREVEGQSYAELAEILGIPIGTVRSRLFAAREALRQVWQVGDQTSTRRSL